MSLVQLYIPSELAHAAVEELAEMRGASAIPHGPAALPPRKVGRLARTS
jgi:hypothetical protein